LKNSTSIYEEKTKSTYKNRNAPRNQLFSLKHEKTDLVVNKNNAYEIFTNELYDFYIALKKYTISKLSSYVAQNCTKH
jgi:hypothetical protein